jgi:hypothetical protein
MIDVVGHAGTSFSALFSNPRSTRRPEQIEAELIDPPGHG